MGAYLCLAKVWWLKNRSIQSKTSVRSKRVVSPRAKRGPLYLFPTVLTFYVCTVGIIVFLLMFRRFYIVHERQSHWFYSMECWRNWWHLLNYSTTLITKLLMQTGPVGQNIFLKSVTFYVYSLFVLINFFWSALPCYRKTSNCNMIFCVQEFIHKLSIR